MLHPLSGRRASARRACLATAVAVALCGTALPVLAMECAKKREGDTLVFSRNPLEADGYASRYHYGGNDIYPVFDMKGLTRVEVNGCNVGTITYSAAEATTPVEVVYNNGNGYHTDPPRSIGTQWLDLTDLKVLDGPGENRRNVITVNGGGVLHIWGPGGPTPTEINVYGGELGGAFNASSAGPSGLIRDNDRFNLYGGHLDTVLYLGGGADVFTASGGSTSALFTVYGDQGIFSQADLNDPKNRFDDLFIFEKGVINEAHGDSGPSEARRDATGRYTGDSVPAGNDHFILRGGWVRDLAGDDGDDLVEIFGVSGLRDFQGGYGSDTVEVMAGASTDHLYSLQAGQSRGFMSGYDDRAGSADTIRFHGQQFEASGIGVDTYCVVGEEGCRKHLTLGDWEHIELLDGAKLTLYASTMALGNELGDDLGDWSRQRLVIDASSALVARNAAFIPGVTFDSILYMSVDNGGTIDLGNDAPGDVLRVHGDFTGGGRVLMSTVLGDDASATDRLSIDGRISGQTVLDIRPVAGSAGAQTREGIVVVSAADGAAAPDAFALRAPLTTENGLWQYRLVRLDSGTHQGSFALTSAVPASSSPPTTPIPPPPPSDPATPPPGTPTTTPPVTPPDTSAIEHLLAPRVPVYATAATAAHRLAGGTLPDATARGDRNAAAGVTRSGREWLRVQAGRTDTRGDRFGLDQDAVVLQAGLDLQDEAQVRRGLSLAFGSARSEVHDHLRPTLGGFASPVASHVGDGRTRIWALGAYQWLQGRAGYLDLAMQAGRVHVQLSDIDGIRTHGDGWTSAVSVEVGRELALGTQSSWQPQAQLVASHTRIDGVDDGLVRSDDSMRNALLARVGARFDLNAGAAPGALRIHALANVWRDLHDDGSVRLYGGLDTLTVQPDDTRSWAELGLGIDRTTPHGRGFASLSGQRGLGGHSRTGAAVQAGWRFDW